MKRICAKTIILLMSSTCIISCVNKDVEYAKEILLHDTWTVQSSAKVGQDGKVISSPEIDVSAWYKATVPSTIMGVLTDNGLYQDLFEGTNYKEADKAIFDVSWWYRKTFDVDKEDIGKQMKLVFDGISYRANIWLNGELIASKDPVYGSFCRFSFDITKYINNKNTLAIEVFRAQSGDPNIGFVDWNPRPLDENMGVFREVRLFMTGDVDMTNTWVSSKVNTENLDEAWLNIETRLKNLSNKEIKGYVKGRIENIDFSIPVTLKANEAKTVKITPDEVKELYMKNPRLWWCTGMGSPELYDLDLHFVIGNKISAKEEVTFGIRDIDSYITENGDKGFILNGRKVLIKSAGWTDDIFLRDTFESNEKQIKYVKDMNLNMVRFENIWGTSQNIYDLCDRYGLLAFAGWSCQWEWAPYIGIPDDEFGSIKSPHDMDLLMRYLESQAVWLRNHPSLIVWMGGSDKLLRPELERRTVDFLAANTNFIYVGAAKGKVSEISGPTGMKMLGPYEYVGPNYWYIDTLYGGAYGFNTETGPGAQIPVQESIEKMVTKDKMWPVGENWDYHCTTSTTALNSMEVLTKAIEGKYGKPSNLKEYLDGANLLSYESTKSMFEAFRVNRPKTTGIVQWMLNSAWPSMYWQLYDYYMIPVSAYYAVKTANEPIQLIYNYKDDGIYIVNESVSEAEGLKAVIKGFSLDSKLLYQEERILTIDKDEVNKFYTIDNSFKNSFLSLTLYDKNGNLIASNFYTLSSSEDTYKWDKTNWVGTPMENYSDFKDLRKIANADIEVSAKFEDANSILVELENKSNTIAFFTQLLVKDMNGEIFQPVFWSDNYVSVLPGEKKILKCLFEGSLIKSNQAKLQIKGWNIADNEIVLE